MSYIYRFHVARTGIIADFGPGDRVVLAKSPGNRLEITLAEWAELVSQARTIRGRAQRFDIGRVVYDDYPLPNKESSDEV